MELDFNILRVKEKQEDNKYTEVTKLLNCSLSTFLGLANLEPARELLRIIDTFSITEIEVIIKDRDLFITPLSMILHMNTPVHTINSIFISNSDIKLYGGIEVLCNILNDNLFDSYDETLKVNSLVRYTEVCRINNYSDLFKFEYTVLERVIRPGRSDRILVFLHSNVFLAYYESYYNSYNGYLNILSMNEFNDSEVEMISSIIMTYIEYNIDLIQNAS